MIWVMGVVGCGWQSGRVVIAERGPVQLEYVIGNVRRRLEWWYIEEEQGAWL